MLSGSDWTSCRHPSRKYRSSSQHIRRASVKARRIKVTLRWTHQAKMSAALLRRHDKLWCNLAGIPELVNLLQSRGTGVFLVSGGFRVIIDPIADILKIPRDHIFANKILFDVRYDCPLSLCQRRLSHCTERAQKPCVSQEHGSYAGFDETELTSRSGGKAAAARLIKVLPAVQNANMSLHVTS